MYLWGGLKAESELKYKSDPLMLSSPDVQCVFASCASHISTHVLCFRLLRQGALVCVCVALQLSAHLCFKWETPCCINASVCAACTVGATHIQITHRTYTSISRLRKRQENLLVTIRFSTDPIARSLIGRTENDTIFERRFFRLFLCMLCVQRLTSSARLAHQIDN